MPKAPLPEDLEIRTFDGDTERLAKLIYKSWLYDKKRSSIFMEYDKDWLDWNFDMPGQEKRHLLAAYKDNEPVGFLCSLNRDMVYKNKVRSNCLTGTLMTVHPDYRRRGIAWNLIQQAKDRVVDKAFNSKYGAFFGYLYTRRASAPLTAKMAKMYKPMGVSVEVMLKAKHMAKVLRPEKLGEAPSIGFLSRFIMKRKAPVPEARPKGEVRLLRPGDHKELMNAFNAYAKKVDFARAWNKKTFARQFKHEPVSDTLVLERDGRVAGAVNYHRVRLCDSGKLFPISEIDNVLFPPEPEEATAFMAEVLRQMKAEGHYATMVYKFDYFDIKPLKEVGFITYPRVVLFLGHAFHPDIDLKKVKSAYIDFR